MPDTPDTDTLTDLWARSDVLPSGEYGVTVTYGPDRAWTFTPDEARLYAAACVRRATEAEHDAAFLRLILASGEDREVALFSLVELREKRPGPVPYITPLDFQPGVTGAGKPFLMVVDGGTSPAGQITPNDLRDHACGVLQALAASELDTALYRMLTIQMTLSGDRARAVVGSLHTHWPKGRDGSG
jgi:hypothetical protein